MRFKGDISVFAFEPEPDNNKRLNDNILANSLSGDVIAYGIGISSVRGLDRFYLNPQTFRGGRQALMREAPCILCIIPTILP